MSAGQPLIGWPIGRPRVYAARTSHSAVQVLGKERRVVLPFSPGRGSRGLTKE